MLSKEKLAELHAVISAGFIEQAEKQEDMKMSVVPSAEPVLSRPTGKVAVVPKEKAKPMPALLHDRRWGYD